MFDGILVEDVTALVREGTQEGTLEAAEANLISNIFSFTERSIRTLMTPRTQVVAVAVNTPLAEVIYVMTEHDYARIPVYQESLDPETSYTADDENTMDGDGH